MRDTSQDDEIRREDDTRWRDVPYAFAVLPVCPACKEVDNYIGIKTEATEPNGESTRQAVCRRCSRRFKISWGLPSDSDGWANPVS